MTNAHENAGKALRAATEALRDGVRVNDDADTIRPREAPSLAYDVADTLDALVALLHSVDLDPAPATTAQQTMESVARHIHDAAGLAHEVAQGHKPHQRPLYGRPRGGDPGR